MDRKLRVSNIIERGTSVFTRTLKIRQDIDATKRELLKLREATSLTDAKQRTVQPLTKAKKVQSLTKLVELSRGGTLEFAKHLNKIKKRQEQKSN